MFESAEANRLRADVVSRVRALWRGVGAALGVRKGMGAEEAGRASCQLLTFGSYRLEVHGPSTDIDCLCLAPRHVTREDFFAAFPAALSGARDVTEVLSLIDA